MLIHYEPVPGDSVVNATSSSLTPFFLGVLGSLVVNALMRRSQPTTVVVNIDAGAPQ